MYRIAPLRGTLPGFVDILPKPKQNPRFILPTWWYSISQPRDTGCIPDQFLF